MWLCQDIFQTSRKLAGNWRNKKEIGGKTDLFRLLERICQVDDDDDDAKQVYFKPIEFPYKNKKTQLPGKIMAANIGEKYCSI